MSFVIDIEKCMSCGLCTDVCPEEAINAFGIFRIEAGLCTACGLCQESCPADAIQLQ